jgi:hypothetical protein
MQKKTEKTSVTNDNKKRHDNKRISGGAKQRHRVGN